MRTASRAGPCAYSRGHPLHKWFDVRVEAEEVVGVVLLLQCCQPLVVGAVGDANPVLVIAAEVIDVGTTGEGLQRPPEVAGPRNVLVGVRCVEPLRDDYGRIRESAMWKGRRLGVDSACSAANGLNKDPRQRGGLGSRVLREDLDGLVGEICQKVGLSVVIRAGRKPVIKDALLGHIGYGA